MGIILFGVILTFLGLVKLRRGQEAFNGLYKTTQHYRLWSLCLWAGVWIMWLGFIVVTTLHFIR